MNPYELPDPSPEADEEYPGTWYGLGEERFFFFKNKMLEEAEKAMGKGLDIPAICTRMSKLCKTPAELLFVGIVTGGFLEFNKSMDKKRDMLLAMLADQLGNRDIN